MAPADLHNDIDNRFTFHPVQPPPDDGPGQEDIYMAFRKIAREAAHFIADNSPVSREQSLAITHLEEAVFWANAAVARHT